MSPNRPSEPITERLVIAEVFGPTWQGEGPSAGRRAGFVRLGRCNLSCQWCDTPFTWDWDRFDPQVELSERSTVDVLDQLDRMNVDMVVITGGEPLLQQRSLGTLLSELARRMWRVEIETNGTVAPGVTGDLVHQWNVSPKLANSGIARERRYHPDVLRAFVNTGRAVFKFVVADVSDLKEVAVIVTECGLRDVWIMPEGCDAAAVTGRLRDLAAAVLAREWNLTPRLHTLIWDDRRGV